MQQSLKTHFALNLSAYNKFLLIGAFKGLFWLRNDKSKVVLILHEYTNINFITISLRDSFGGQPSFENSLRTKTRCL